MAPGAVNEIRREAMMTKTIRAVATAGLMVAVVAPLSAQGRQQATRAMQGRALERGAAPGMLLAGQVQAALRSKQELGLDAGQVSALEDMRSELERLAETARLEREERRSELRERPESQEERVEQRRALADQVRARRARTDTAVAEIQARFEAVLPPLQRQELRRDRLDDRRSRMARSGPRDGRAGALNVRGRRGGEALDARRGPPARAWGPRGRAPAQGERWGR